MGLTSVLPQIPEALKQAILAQRQQQLPAGRGVPPASPVTVAPPAPVPIPGSGGGQQALRAAMMPPPAPQQNPPLSGDYGAPGSWSDPKRMTASVTPMTPAGVQPGVSQAPPPASDDPTLAMPELPKPPDLTNSPLAAMLRQRQQTQEQLNAVPKPDPNKLRPKLWERLAGIALGATQLRNPENAGEVAGRVVNRRLNQANSDYAERARPLLNELKTEDEGMGAAEAAGKIPQQDFENRLGVAKEGREQVDAKARNSKFATQSEKYKNAFVAGSERKDANSSTGWVADTFGGETKEFTPKDYTKQPKEPKTWQEAESMATAATDPDEKKRLKGLAKEFKQADDTKTRIEHPPKEPKETATDANGFTPSESKEINSRTRTAHKELDALAQKRASFGMMPDSEFTRGALPKIDARIEELNKQIDAVQDDVIGRRKGGNVSVSVKTETKTAPAKSTAGGATPPASLWKGKEGKRFTLKNPVSGKQESWHLVNGQPEKIGG